MSVERAKALLEQGDYTCAFVGEGREFTSRARGVKPLVAFLEGGTVPKGCCAADKVVGKATAYLYVLLAVRALFAKVISIPALQVLQAQGIAVEYERAVPYIINRQGTGVCPFEGAVAAAEDPATAYTAIKNKMREMGISIDRKGEEI